MTIQLSVPPKRELKPRITVIGVGGAGGNTVNNMIKAGLNGVDFVVANTDAQALTQSHAERRIQMGAQLTEGLGAGSNPEIGRDAAAEAMADIMDQIQGSHMVFVTAGMGGGTGTGAVPVIARACRDEGILTVGVVTKPFDFEGPKRMRSAEIGIAELEADVDTLIIIPNQNLFRVVTERTGFVEVFAIADEVLHSGVASVTDLITKPGLINLDFADVKMAMNEMGKAMMGTGEAKGATRALDAAEAAIANPLLEHDSMQGATGVLINITGANDMALYEVEEAVKRITQEVSGDANITFGAIHDEALEGSMRVSVVATGIDTKAQAALPDEGARVVSLNRGSVGSGGSGLMAQRPSEAALPQSEFGAGEEESLFTGPNDMRGQGSASLVSEEDVGEDMDAAKLPRFLEPPTMAPRKKTVRKLKEFFLNRVLSWRKSKVEVEPQSQEQTETQAPPPEQTSAFDIPKMQPEPAVERVAVKTATHTEDKALARATNRGALEPLTLDELETIPEQEAVQTVAETVTSEVEGAGTSAREVSQKAEMEPDIADIVDAVEKTTSPSASKTQMKTGFVEAQAVAPATVEVKDERVALSRPVQKTVQTTMSTSAFDDAQLDIPAFLRRSE